MTPSLAVPIFGLPFKFSIDELKARKERELERWKNFTEEKYEQIGNKFEKLESRFEKLEFNVESTLDSTLDVLETKFEYMIDWLFEDYNEEISVFQDFYNSLYKGKLEGCRGPQGRVFLPWFFPTSASRRTF